MELTGKYKCYTDNRKYEVIKHKTKLLLRCLDCQTKGKEIEVSANDIKRLLDFKSFEKLV